MAKTSTTMGIPRSYGGDDTRTAYAGSMCMAATFYFDPTAANTTAAQKSSTDTSAVLLPTNAVVFQIQVNAAATGGTNPTFDMGWINNDDSSTFDVDGLIAEGDADAGASVFNYATATAGADLGGTMSTTNLVKITGGVGDSAATGGAVSGIIFYYVSDSGADSI